MDLSSTSWQERYHASGVYTLRCKLADQPGILGMLTTAIGQTGTHVGNIAVVGVDNQFKHRDITVYCSNDDDLNKLLRHLSRIDGVEVVEVRNDVLKIHHRGAINVSSRIPITTINDLRMLYTPGVASVCEKIKADPISRWELTGLCDRVAIVTNGTAVLGLGNIGVGPSLPVMEGKAAIFAEFSGISAFPILIDSEKVEVVVEIVMRIAQSFGAIQLEDIAAPACFAIEEQLQKRLDIPVCHDDQHGTATVLLAALINGLKQVNKCPEQCSALILGAGAAGYAIAKMLLRFGIGEIVVYDSTGPLFNGRTEHMNVYKKNLAQLTNKKNEQGTLAEGFRGKDIFVGVAKPNMVDSAMVTSMAQDALIFPLSNPEGEISVEAARKAGAAMAADGRTINNALAYPGLFRGALDAKARSITLEMQLAAAQMLASLAPEGNLLPNMLDRTVHQQVARVVAQAWRIS
jgi:malate dehydrogenase (oxaloacetate-decarboxylating)